MKVDDLQVKVNLVMGGMNQILRTTFQSQRGDQGKLCTGQTVSSLYNLIF